MTPAELKSLRMRSEMTMTELARRLGVSISLVSIWERGKATIPEDRLKAIKKACGNDAKERSEFGKESSEYAVWKRHEATLSRDEPVQVRMCQVVELGPETMKALKDLIETAVQQIKHPSLTPEVIRAQKEGDRYRAKTQEILGRG